MLNDVKKAYINKMEKEIEKIKKSFEDNMTKIKEINESIELIDINIKESKKGFFRGLLNNDKIKELEAEKTRKIEETEKLKQIYLHYNGEKITIDSFENWATTMEEDIIQQIKEASTMSELINYIKNVESYRNLDKYSDLEIAINVLNEEESPIVLVEEDKFAYSRKDNILDLGKLFLVKKLESIPKDKKIVVEQDNDGNKITEFNVNGEEVFVEEEKEKPYLVIIPLETVDKNQIESVEGGKICVKGDIELNEDSIFVCPKGELETIKQNNFKKENNIEIEGYMEPTSERFDFNIIEYEGSIDGYAEVLIAFLGGRVEIIDKRLDR